MSQQAMQAVVFQAPGKFGLEKRPVPPTAKRDRRNCTGHFGVNLYERSAY